MVDCKVGGYYVCCGWVLLGCYWGGLWGWWMMIGWYWSEGLLLRYGHFWKMFDFQ